MALTGDFKETIQARVERDPAFREELLREGVECLLSGDLDTGKAVLRVYINVQDWRDAYVFFKHEDKAPPLNSPPSS